MYTKAYKLWIKKQAISRNFTKKTTGKDKNPGRKIDMTLTDRAIMCSVISLQFPVKWFAYSEIAPHSVNFYDLHFQVDPPPQPHRSHRRREVALMIVATVTDEVVMIFSSYFVNSSPYRLCSIFSKYIFGTYLRNICLCFDAVGFYWLNLMQCIFTWRIKQ